MPRALKSRYFLAKRRGGQYGQIYIPRTRFHVFKLLLTYRTLQVQKALNHSFVELKTGSILNDTGTSPASPQRFTNHNRFAQIRGDKIMYELSSLTI